MKRCIACILLVMLVMSLASCKKLQSIDQEPSSTPSATNDVSENQTDPTSLDNKKMSEYLTEEDGWQYLILPISKNKIRVREQYTQYLDDIDLDLLRAAEENISGKLSQHSNNSCFYLQVDEGYLCLYAEVIVKLDSPASADNIGGCGIDHEHLFFCERITK